MDATIIIALVPVILLVAFIVYVVRTKIAGGGGERSLDLREAVTGLVIVLVAVLIIASMTSSTVSYTYSEESKTLYINQSIEGSGQPWDSYAEDVRSVVIGNSCKLVGPGTLDSLTSLEYVSIEEGVSVRPGAFGISFEDALGTTVGDVSGRDFVGAGDGTVYLCDPSVFTYTSGGKDIGGLASGYASAAHLVFPAENNGIAIEGIAQNAFINKTAVEEALSHPDCAITALGVNSFNGCTSLSEVSLPKATTLGANVFYNCTSLIEVSLPEAVTLGSQSFKGCSSLSEVSMPKATTLQTSLFENCIALGSVSLPEARTVGDSVFSGCSSLSEASLPKATSIGLNCLLNCTSLESFSAPALVTIGTNALRATAITQAIFQHATDVGANAFQGCESLKTVRLPAAVTIGAAAFSGCTGITSVVFGSGLATIGSNAFANWSFYESDGTTTIDKTVASNLAGHTFTGTASALVMQS